MRRILIPVAALLVIATAGTALLMSRGGDNPDNLLQAALSTTCDPVLTRYFDAVVDEGGNIWHYRYDGEDYHGVHTLADGSTVEEIQKGPNFYYIANPGDDWSTFRYESSFIGICGPAAEAAATRSVVVDPEDFDQGGLNYRYLGDSTLDGQAVKHYISAGLSAELTESLTESLRRVRRVRSAPQRLLPMTLSMTSRRYMLTSGSQKSTGPARARTTSFRYGAPCRTSSMARG